MVLSLPENLTLPALSDHRETPATPVSEPVLNRLAAGLSHTVNNALTGVFGYLELGLRQATPGSPLHGHLENGLDCAVQAAAAVRRVVAFASRAQRGVAFETVALRLLAREAADAIRARAVSGISVLLVADSPCYVQADSSLLRSALDELMQNALEAMPTGGMLTLHVEELDGRCHLSVSDTGPGLPPEIRSHPFQAFRTTKASMHLGLGLVLCRDAIQTMDGKLTLASVAGQGTTATLSFPVAAPVSRPDAAQPTGVAPPFSPSALARAGRSLQLK
jgi:signal transduction histidine kinase